MYRVEHDGAYPLEKVTVLFDQDAVEASLKERAHAPVGAVDLLSVDPVELPPAFGKRGIGRFHQQRVGADHRAVGRTEPVKAFAGPAQGSEERDALVVGVVENAIASLVTACGDRVQRLRQIPVARIWPYPGCTRLRRPQRIRRLGLMCNERPEHPAGIFKQGERYLGPNFVRAVVLEHLEQNSAKMPTQCADGLVVCLAFLALFLIVAL